MSLTRPFTVLAAGLAITVLSLLPLASAQALNILLCNDDGVTAANLRALKQTLAAAGHSVIVTAPIDNQSGTGGYIKFLQPIPPLTGAERGAKALGLAAGSPGIGSDAGDADVHYVNATPVAACLYGIDVQAPKKWKAAPDLVISGPNEGNNAGPVVISSGTVSVLFYAINRGLPALAVSDAEFAKLNWSPTMDRGSRPFEVAQIVQRLVQGLADSKRNGGGRLLPAGIGLNVNVPAFAAGSGSKLPFRFTHVGTATSFLPVFYEKLSDSPAAVAEGAGQPLPGIGFTDSATLFPSDTAADAESNLLKTKTAVTISPVQGVPEAPRELQDALKRQLKAIAR